MPLKEKNYIEEINKLTEKDWKPLLDLILEMEKADSFGEMHMPHVKEENVFSMPFWEGNELVDRFLKLVEDIPLMIQFDWGSWEDGFEMLRSENFNFDTVDIPTKCKLITLIVRKERFVEGSLKEAFDSGQMLRILTSIKNQLGERD